MKISTTDPLGTEPRKNDRRISLLNNASDPVHTLPTPPNGPIAGRWV